MTLLTIFGGVALVLLGGEFIRRGVDRVFGHGLHSWIARMGQRTWSTVASGCAFGAAAPSSTAQTLLATHLVNAGKLPAERMLVFLLAANVGMTLKLFFLAFHVNRYYPVLLIVGVFFYIFRKTETSRGIGLAVLGLAMVFLSMDIISGAVRVLAVDHDFQTVLGVIVNHPWWLFVFAAAITLSVQSSTATVGLVMAVAEGSGVNGALVIPSILGANLGIGFTCLMVGWPTIEGRRLGAAALVLRALIALSAMSAIGWLVPLLSSRQVAPIREAAEIHAAFNLLALAASILVGGLVGSVVRRAVAVDSSREVLLPQTALDELALPTPSFALNNAARETLSMLEEVKRMVKDVWIGYETSDLPLVREVQARDARVDRYNTSIRNYLSRIPVEVLTPRDSHVQFGLLHFVSQLEDVADVVDKLLCRQIAKHIENPRAMLVDDIADLTTMHHKVLQRFDLAILIFTTRDRSYASSFTKASKEIEEWCIEAERRHYARVVATVDASGIKGSTYFLDILNAQRRIAGQINTIGHTFGLMR